MSSEKPNTESPLRYILRCGGCHEEIEVCPSQMSGHLIVCPHCRYSMPTPIYRLLTKKGSK